MEPLPNKNIGNTQRKEWDTKQNPQRIESTLISEY